MLQLKEENKVATATRSMRHLEIAKLLDKSKTITVTTLRLEFLLNPQQQQQPVTRGLPLVSKFDSGGNFPILCTTQSFSFKLWDPGDSFFYCVFLSP